MVWPVRIDLNEGWTAAGVSSLGQETGTPIPVTLPHQWTNDPRFAGTDSAVRYRTKWDPKKSTKRTNHGLKERHWLEVNGCFYSCEFAINEHPNETREGYFHPHAFELTDAEPGASVSLDVRCDVPISLRSKRQLTGVFQHSDAIAKDFNPGGLWQSVSYLRTGPVAMSRLRMLCTSATEEQATLAARAILHTDEARRVQIQTSISKKGASTPEQINIENFDLAAGENRVKWHSVIRDPALWWPAGWGAQPLYDIAIEVFVETSAGKQVVSDNRLLTTGLRTIEADDLQFKINGKKIYLRGANYLPTKRELSLVTAEDTKADIDRALDLNLNMLHVFGHVAHPSFYAAADAAGLLVWQDMPMMWGYAASVRTTATLQARELVNYYGHHPSIIAWFGHNQPNALDDLDTKDRTKSQAQARYLLKQQLPTYSRTILGTLVRRAFEDADNTRPIFAHSGVLPHLGARGSDSHLFIGWERGDLEDFSQTLARIPTLARFVGAFGAQSVPDSDSFLPVSSWPEWNWRDISMVFCANQTALERHSPVVSFHNFREWMKATQDFQADVLRHHIERVRLLKYHPNGGFSFSYLTDAQPAISHAVFDHERQPKAAVETIRDVCRPTIAIMDWPDNTYDTDTSVEFDVFVVNDQHHEFKNATIDATVTTSAGKHSWSWEGNLEADKSSLVGTIGFRTPKEPGDLKFEINLTSPHNNEIKQTRSYKSLVV